MPPRNRLGHASTQMPPKRGGMPPRNRFGHASIQMPPKGG